MSRTSVGTPGLLCPHLGPPGPVVSGVSEAPEPGEVSVAGGVVTVVELQHLRPVRQEEEVGEAGPVQSHQQVRVLTDRQLGLEGDLRTEPRHRHLVLPRPVQSLHQVSLVDDPPYLVSGQQSHSQSPVSQHSVLRDVEARQEELRETVEQLRSLATIN